MHFEPDPTEVVQKDRHRQRRSDADSREDSRAEPLGQGDSGDGGGDAQNAAGPGPPGSSAELRSPWPRLPDDQLEKKNTQQPR